MITLSFHFRIFLISFFFFCSSSSSSFSFSFSSFRLWLICVVNHRCNFLAWRDGRLQESVKHRTNKTEKEKNQCVPVVMKAVLHASNDQPASPLLFLELSRAKNPEI